MISPLKEAVRFLLRVFIRRNRELIYREAGFLNGFMHLLMKQRNTGARWTRNERDELKSGLRHLSCYVPVLIIFLLPGGALLLPFLADILDRRKRQRPRAG
ncbi:MAG: hypothetical protein M1497_10620 [Nitrospirae bacterium]|nr:hypothetical protein [Nitrospirota bacterium]